MAKSRAASRRASPARKRKNMLIDQSKLDGPVVMEFRHVLDCADLHGIPFVWVNDPDELFPPWTRP